MINNENKIELKTCFQADLVYHLLAHMDLKDNASNLYCKKYIEHFNKTRTTSKGLEEKLKNLVDIYIDGFEKFAVINFMPFYVSDFEELRQSLLSMQMFSDEDKKKFLIPFMDIAQNEMDTYYKDYWVEKTKNMSFPMVEFSSYFNQKIKCFDMIFKYFRTSPNVFVSLSLTRYGRGFGVDNFFSAVIGFPEDEKSYSFQFFQAFHEMTHQFTDKLINAEILLGNETHALSESLAILTDFYLFRKYCPELLEDYCNMFIIDKCSEASAEEKYSVPDELYEIMVNLINCF